MYCLDLRSGYDMTSYQNKDLSPRLSYGFSSLIANDSKNANFIGSFNDFGVSSNTIYLELHGINLLIICLEETNNIFPCFTSVEVFEDFTVYFRTMSVGSVKEGVFPIYEKLHPGHT